jgi:hypothetical protein
MGKATGPEAKIEWAVVKYAESLGCIHRKMNGPGADGWPDRLFICPRGIVVWIEFKAPGMLADPLQVVIIRRLKLRGQVVHVVDNTEDGKRIIHEACHG